MNSTPATETRTDGDTSADLVIVEVNPVIAIVLAFNAMDGDDRLVAVNPQEIVLCTTGEYRRVRELQPRTQFLVNGEVLRTLAEPLRPRDFMLNVYRRVITKGEQQRNARVCGRPASED